jgi:hypothetical protein
MFLDVQATDISAAWDARGGGFDGGGGGGGGDPETPLRYFREGGSRRDAPKRDIALVLVEEAPRPLRLLSAAGSWAEGSVDGDGAVSAAPAAVALAAAATGLLLSASTERAWGRGGRGAYFCPFLKAGRVYHLFALSLAGYAGGAAASAGAAVVELHYPSGRPLNAALAVQPAAWGARALLCRTLTLGAPTQWGSDRCGHVHIVRHSDGAGFLLAAANAHGVDSFRVTHGVDDGGEERLLRSRADGGGSLTDVVPPPHALLLMCVAPRPGAGAWGYGSSTSIQSPAEAGARVSGGAAAGTLHGAMPFPLG